MMISNTVMTKAAHAAVKPAITELTVRRRRSSLPVAGVIVYVCLARSGPPATLMISNLARAFTTKVTRNSTNPTSTKALK